MEFTERYFFKNNEYTNFFDYFKDVITDELEKMIENDDTKENKETKKINNIMIYKSDKNTIDKCVSFEQTYKEIPCRSLILVNIPEGTTEEEIKYLINSFGDYQELNLENLKNGRVIVRFFDIRDAMIMRTSKILIHSRNIIMSFGNDLKVVDKKKPPNNGTIVVFNLPECASDDKIASIFSVFGDIRDIRKTPNKKTQRFIEFYDSRSAEDAKAKMKNAKMTISNFYCKINVEFSLPGNYRVNYEKFYVNNIPTIQRRNETYSN